MTSELVVSDIDGVLLTDTVDPQDNFDALRFLKDECNIQTTVASGRPTSLIVPIVDIEALTGPIIAENGGTITDIYGNVLSSTPVPDKAKEYIKEIHDKPDVGTIVFLPTEYPDTYYIYEADTDVVEKLITDFKITSLIRTKDFSYFMSLMYKYTYSKIVVIMKKEIKHMPNPENVNLCQSIYRNTTYFDITADSVSKGAAIRQIADKLNIALCKIVVLGNDYNDISMFELPVGCKIAVNYQDRLPQELRQNATLVISPEQVAGTLRQIATLN